jgi:hypothetical protein
MSVSRKMAVVCFLTVLLLLSGEAFKLGGTHSGTEAPTGFSTPTLTDNPGSLSVSNGMPEVSGETFAGDQATFEEEDGVDKVL